MRNVRKSWKFFTGAAFVAVLAWAAFGNTASSQTVKSPGRSIKGQPIDSLLSTGGQRVLAARTGGTKRPLFVPIDLGPEDGLVDPSDDPGPDPEHGDGHAGAIGGGAGANAFVNDPCLDPAAEAPFPENFRRTVQSETTVAVLNSADNEAEDSGDSGDDAAGKLMVAGYNDSFGFYNNKQGLSGFSYSTDGGKSWIDGGGLPPKLPTGAPAGTLGSDAYFGDPVVVVHHRTKTFYYASIYQNAAGSPTLSVNRGHFMVAAAQGVESNSNTRCNGAPAKNGIPDPPAAIRKRIIWEPPVEAVVPVLNGPGFKDDDFLDKEWLYVDQKTGVLYLTYTRFGFDGSTPIELVRSFDGGHTWTAPSIIVPNLDDTFNTATQAIVTPTGRVVVTWNARTFPGPTFATERDQRTEVGFSDNCQTPAPCTFGAPVIVAHVNPQAEPRGYNRGRAQILNVPYIAVDKGRDDGVVTDDKKHQNGFGNVYISYFDGRTPLATAPNPNPVFARAADIHLSRSTTNGTTWGAEIKVNDDNGQTSHVFPSVQVNKHGKVFVSWQDRRVDPVNNALTDTLGVISNNLGVSFGKNVRITDVSADWFVRADARPNFGDYNSSTVINFTDFATIWGDGRFPPGTFTQPPTIPVARRKATPDTMFAVFKEGTGAGDNNGKNGNNND